jgi:PRTRC genetic system protein C
MALEVTGAKRKFILEKGKGKKENIELKDPHPDMTVDEVVKHHSRSHPELSNATVDGPIMEDGFAVYKFGTVIGDKG